MPLRDLLDRVSGEAIAKAIGLRHDRSREAYREQRVVDERSIDTLQELRHVVIGFYRHQWKHALAESEDTADLPEHVMWPLLSGVLERKYAGGLGGALRAARLGVDGGLRGVIETIYEYLKTEHVKAYCANAIESAIDRTDWPARLALARELLGSVARVVPRNEQVRAEELASRLADAVEKRAALTSYPTKGRGKGG